MHAGGRGEVRVQRDVGEEADAAEVDAERRARVEAEPAEPEDDHAERRERHVVARDRRSASRPARELADARPEQQRPGEPGERALVVDDGRAGEVLHALREQPAVRAPDPVRDERVDQRVGDAEGEVDPQPRPFGHRAPDDRERHGAEDDLEQIPGGARDRREPAERRRSDRQQLVDGRAGSRSRPRARCRRRRRRCRSRRRSRRATRSRGRGRSCAAMWPTFFIRVSPASRKAKPACMNITRIAARTTQIVLAANRQFLGRHATSTSSSLAPVRLWVTLNDGRRPDDPVARLVTGARGVGDGLDDACGDLVLRRRRRGTPWAGTATRRSGRGTRA